MAIAATAAPARAAPRVALLTPGLAATDVELVRAGLEASGLAVRLVGAAELPASGGDAEAAAARAEAAARLDEAHADFVATRFGAARAVAVAAERAARRWGGEPRMARLLVELALVASQSGDADAIARAAAYGPAATLDPARFNPTLRAALAAAQARLGAQPRVDIEVITTPPGAALFVDGEERGVTPARLALPRGHHALALALPGFAPVAESHEVEAEPSRPSTPPSAPGGLEPSPPSTSPSPQGGLEPSPPSTSPSPQGRLDARIVERTLVPLDADGRLGQLRAQLEDGVAPVAEAALALAATRFGCDAAVAVTGPGAPARVWLGGARVAPRALEVGARALSEVAAALGRQLQADCALAHTPPERGRAGAPLTLEVHGGACVARVHAVVHVDGSRPSTSPSPQGRLDERAPVERGAPLAGGRAILSIADLPSSTRPYSLRYRLWGESPSGSVVGALGSEAAPLRVLIDADRAPPRPRRWYHKWWVWTLIGGAVTAGVVAATVATYRPASEARLVGP